MLVFPGIPNSLYTIIVEPPADAKGRRKVEVWGTRSSLQKAKEEGRHAKKMYNGDRRVLIIGYDKRNVRFGGKRCWEVK